MDPLLPHVYNLPAIRVLDKLGTVTSYKHILTRHHHPRPTADILVYSWCCTFYGFGQVLGRFFLAVRLFYLIL